MSVIRVALVDDHEMFLELLTARLAVEPDIDVVARSSTGEEALRDLPVDVDVVLCDHHLPDTDGVRLAAAIIASRPEASVIMLTSSSDPEVLLSAIAAGCAGFVAKTSPMDEVLAAIRSAAAGESIITPADLSGVLRRIVTAEPTPDVLTSREHDVLDVMALGSTNREIADRLFISVDTVRNHTASILRKLGSHSKLEAVVTATKRGLIDLRPSE